MYTSLACPSVRLCTLSFRTGPHGRLVDWAHTLLATALNIVRKPADERGFAAIIPGRRAVERTFTWLTAHRRLPRDYEHDPAISEAMIRWAAIDSMTRRLAANKVTLYKYPR